MTNPFVQAPFPLRPMCGGGPVIVRLYQYSLCTLASTTGERMSDGEAKFECHANMIHGCNFMEVLSIWLVLETCQYAIDNQVPALKRCTKVATPESRQYSGSVFGKEPFARLG